MTKTTEGQILASKNIQDNIFNYDYDKIDPTQKNESLLKILRQQFIDDIKLAIDNFHIADPNHIHQALSTIKQASPQYLQFGQDAAFTSLCKEVLQKIGYQWSYLSYWVSSEQNEYYQLYWKLNGAIETYQKKIKMFKHAKNDLSCDRNINLSLNLGKHFDRNINSLPFKSKPLNQFWNKLKKFNKIIF